MNCPFCQSAFLGDDGNQITWACGTYSNGGPRTQSVRCQNRAADQDVEVDNEVTRRRMRRHFEVDHYGQ